MNEPRRWAAQERGLEASLNQRIRECHRRHPLAYLDEIAERAGANYSQVKEVLQNYPVRHRGRVTPIVPRTTIDNAVRDAFRAVIGRDPFADGG